MQLSELPNIGPKLQALLEAEGITTGEELRAYRRLGQEVGDPFTIVRLSKPGIGPDGSAILHAATRCSLPMCGAGWYVFERRLDGEWVVVGVEGSWVE